MERNGLVALTDLYRISECQGGLKKPCIDEAEDVLAAFSKGYSFDSYMLFHYRGAHPRDEFSDCTVISNYPAPWVEKIIHEGLSDDDPIGRVMNRDNHDVFMFHGTRREAYQKCLENPKGETEAKKSEYLGKVRLLQEEAEREGRLDGIFFTEKFDEYTISLSFSSSLRGQEFESSLNKNIWGELWTALTLMRVAIEQTKTCNTCVPREADGKFFAPRERELLLLILQTPVINMEFLAARMRISVSRVKKILVSIRQKLNRPGASAKELAAIARQEEKI